MFDMNMDIQHLMEACDKSSGACSYNGKKKGNDANTNDPSSNEGCCKKEVCPTTNEVCKNEGCKRESSIFDGAFQALDEFKSDIDLYNKERIAAAKQSGKHAGEKSLINYDKRSKMTRDYGTGAYDGRRNKDKEKPVDAKDKKYIDIYNKSHSKDIDNNLYSRRASREYNKQHPDEIKKAAQLLRKTKNESASIFDSLFSQI